MFFLYSRDSNAKLWKGIIIYKTTNGIFAFWKHLESTHWMMWTRWIEQKKDGHEVEKWPSKKRSSFTPSTNCFSSIDTPYTKDNLHQKQFEKKLRLFITKELVPLSFFRAPFFKRFFLKQNGLLNFPSRHFLVNDILHWVTKKIEEKYVSSILESCHSCTISFDYGCLGWEWTLSWCLCIFWIPNQFC